MHRRRRTLSVDDQKAVDVLLDHAATLPHAPHARHAMPVAPTRLMAASKLLKLLSALPAIEPPADLVARTMRRIDSDVVMHLGDFAATPRTGSRAQVH